MNKIKIRRVRLLRKRLVWMWRVSYPGMPAWDFYDWNYALDFSQWLMSKEGQDTYGLHPGQS